MLSSVTGDLHIAGVACALEQSQYSIKCSQKADSLQGAVAACPLSSCPASVVLSGKKSADRIVAGVIVGLACLFESRELSFGRVLVEGRVCGVGG